MKLGIVPRYLLKVSSSNSKLRESGANIHFIEAVIQSSKCSLKGVCKNDCTCNYPVLSPTQVNNEV